jgi:hypothetical protein
MRVKFAQIVNMSYMHSHCFVSKRSRRGCFRFGNGPSQCMPACNKSAKLPNEANWGGRWRWILVTFFGKPGQGQSRPIKAAQAYTRLYKPKFFFFEGPETQFYQLHLLIH